jgi:hypothetical protein
MSNKFNKKNEFNNNRVGGYILVHKEISLYVDIIICVCS